MKATHPPMNSALHKSWHRQAGLSLIELMISVTIGLILLAGLLSVVSVTSGNSRTNDTSEELLTTGRYALNSLKQEVREAGFRGYTWPVPTLGGSLGNHGSLGTLTGECLAAGNASGDFLSNVWHGVWGANDNNPFSANCIPTASYAANNDILVVRRLSPFPVVGALLNANTLYFQSSYDAGLVFRGVTAAPTGAPFLVTSVPLATFTVQTYVYYISPFSVSAAESPLIPALYRVVLQPDGSMTPELVASGIEHMQIQYGHNTIVTTSPLVVTTQYLNTPPNPDPLSYLDSVDSVRIQLLVRSTKPEPGYSNTESYVMGDQSYTVNDNFRRQLLTTVVQLRN